MQEAYTIKDLGVTFLAQEFLTMLREGLHNPSNKGPLDIRKISVKTYCGKYQ